MSAYVRARAADAAGQTDAAARAYATALNAAPDNPVVAVRAYREGLEAGDLVLADRAAAVLTRLGAPPADAPLQPLAEAAGHGDVRAARAALAAFAKSPLQPLTTSFAAWVAWAEGGDWQAALDGAGKDPLARRFADETRALLLIATRHSPDALAILRALPGDRPELHFAAAQLLAGTGQKAKARSLLVGDDPVLGALAHHLKGVKPSFGFGIARLYTGIAVELQSDATSPLVIALARGALRAEPGNDRARLLLASELAHNGAPDRALRLLREVNPDGPFAGTARTVRVGILAAGGDADASLAAARAAAERPDATPYDLQEYGAALLARHRAADAAAAYARLVTAAPDNGGAWLEYGGALDEAKRWPEARAALERAVALAPDDALALNYLGYARIAHGEDVPAAEKLLERAAALKPDDASITDSLAWAYYRGGDVRRALPMLERAAAGDPANATIAEHLGDAYWSTGRRFEARYAWRAAELVANDEDAPRLAYKLVHGPDGAAPTP